MSLPFGFWPHSEEEIVELARQYINGTHKIPDDYVELLEAPPEAELFLLERAVEQIAEKSRRDGVLTLVYSMEAEFLEDYFDA